MPGQGATTTEHPDGRDAAGPDKAWLWIALLFLALGFAFQGSRSLWNTDEGRYVGNALQMVDSGDYLVPAYSADRVNFTKPPLTYWALAASLDVFGRSTWAVRVPGALAYLLSALLVYAMGRRLVPERPWLPALVYGCAMGPFLAANVVSTDDLLTLFETLAMYGFVAAEFGSGTGSRNRYIYLMWLGFGLAFLTKGPPGLMPLLGVVPYVLRRHGGAGLRRILPLDGLAVFALSGFLWYAVVMLRHPWLVHYYLHNEIYQRIFTGVQNRNPQWYGWIRAYAPVFAIGTLPWWLPLLRGMRKVAGAGRLRTWWREPSAPLFLLLWFFVPLVVFCLAKSRLPVYVLPLFVPLALMIALEMRARFDLSTWRQRVLLAAWVVVLLAVKGGGAYFAHPRADDRLRSTELAQRVPPSRYAALSFVQDTAAGVKIEEHTPWGMRLYLGKPVYGVAWRDPAAQDALCGELARHGSVLFAIDRTIDVAVFRLALSKCPGTQSAALGDWRRRHLVSASSAPAALK